MKTDRTLKGLLNRQLLWTFIPLWLFANVASGQTDSLRSYIRTLIVKNQEGVITDEEKSDLRAYGYALQQKGIQLEENGAHHAEALAAVDSALVFWIAIRESANEAYLRRYRGMLLGTLNRFEEGRVELHMALELFRELQLPSGRAAACYEMSVLFDRSNQLDSAIRYQQEACAFYNEQNDRFKRVANNNQLIHLYTRSKQFRLAESVQLNNEKEMNPELHWNPTINFYYVSYLLFRETGDAARAETYLRLYRNWQHLLREQGTEARSMYEANN